MGLIYVNPEGPNGNPDPLAAARDIRVTFAPHGDERRGDRRADRRRPHLRQDPRRRRPASTSARNPRPRRIEEQGLGWKSSYGTAGADAITSGLEVTWTKTPTKWSNSFFEYLFSYEWELTKSPAGARQWQPKDAPRRAPYPTPTTRQSARADDADDRSVAALRPDLRDDLAALPRHPDEFADAFARAWFKLTHRDMGPSSATSARRCRRGADLAGPGARRSTTR